MLFSFHIWRSLSCNLQLPEEHLSGHVALHASSKNKGAEFQCSLETYKTVLYTAISFREKPRQNVFGNNNLPKTYRPSKFCKWSKRGVFVCPTKIIFMSVAIFTSPFINTSVIEDTIIVIDA